MTRTILAGLSVSVLAVALSGSGCQSTGIGDPCTPEKEYDPTFAGFVEQEVSTEGESFQCQTRLCLVNHFQGRATCPYGQDAMGHPIPPAANACATPGISLPITGPLNTNGTPVDATIGMKVQPQCTQRTKDQTVYCSCRSADINGTQNGGKLLQVPGRLRVHAARELHRRGRRGADWRVLHQERHGVRLRLPARPPAPRAGGSTATTAEA